jgi:hypothetical protein
MYVKSNWFHCSSSALLFIATSLACFGQKDPGVRRGAPGAGAPLPGLMPVEQILFNEGLQRAVQLEAACDDCNDVTLGSHGSGKREPRHPDQLGRSREPL